jgi:hypothetical protein
MQPLGIQPGGATFQPVELPAVEDRVMSLVGDIPSEATDTETT